MTFEGWKLSLPCLRWGNQSTALMKRATCERLWLQLAGKNLWLFTLGWVSVRGLRCGPWTCSFAHNHCIILIAFLIVLRCTKVVQNESKIRRRSQLWYSHQVFPWKRAQSEPNLDLNMWNFVLGPLAALGSLVSTYQTSRLFWMPNRQLEGCQTALQEEGESWESHGGW